MIGLGWSRSMVKRSLDELAEKDYISFKGAANQHGIGAIKILKFDVEEHNSAQSTSEPSKSLENSARLSAGLSARLTGEPSTEPSRPSISQRQQDLQPPKNAVEVKKEKNYCVDAVRRPIYDAVRRPIYAELHHSSKSFSPQKRKQNLESRLIEKSLKDKSFFDDNLDKVQRAAFAATGYTPRDPRKLYSGFVHAVEMVWDKCKDTEISQGNLCSKIIDYCLAQQESCKKLGGPASRSDYYWPPDFQEHRDRLRAQERAREKSQSARVSA